MTLHLTITVPEGVALETDAQKIRADSVDGTFSLLPNHVDYATVLDVGFVSFVDPSDTEIHVAVDRGLLIKKGYDVQVTVRRALRHAPLSASP